MVNIHVYPSPLTHESRILRITDALAQAGVFSCIEVVGVARADLPATEVLDGKRRLVRLPRKLFASSDGFVAKLLRTAEWSMRVLASLRGRRIACINAHSLAVLPLCVLAAMMTGARLVYDTHELETETSGYKGLRQKLGRFVEKLCIRRCDMVVCVSSSIADWYAKTYGLERPTVVRNIPQFCPPAARDLTALRQSMGLQSGRLAFIYQGGFIAGRGVERLLKVFIGLQQVDLVCMGSGPLQPMVAQAAELHANIHLVPPVPPQEVLGYTQAADVGICLTDNSCLSHYYSLPNKIFEYLHAGLPIIVNPLLEQKQMVEQHGCGWVAEEDDAAFSEMLLAIDRAAIAAKRDNVQAATHALNWDEEKARLLQAYRDHGFA